MALAVDLCLSGPDDCGSGHNSLSLYLMTLELGEESPVLSVEIARPEQAEAPLSTPQTVEASELGGDVVSDTSPQPVDCPEFIDDAAIRTPVPPLQPMSVDDFISTFRKPLSQHVLSSLPHPSCHQV